MLLSSLPFLPKPVTFQLFLLHVENRLNWLLNYGFPLLFALIVLLWEYILFHHHFLLHRWLYNSLRLLFMIFLFIGVGLGSLFTIAVSAYLVVIRIISNNETTWRPLLLNHFRYWWPVLHIVKHVIIVLGLPPPIRLLEICFLQKLIFRALAEVWSINRSKPSSS